jgi:hypothetical protein
LFIHPSSSKAQQRRRLRAFNNNILRRLRANTKKCKTQKFQKMYFLSFLMDQLWCGSRRSQLNILHQRPNKKWKTTWKDIFSYKDTIIS